MAADRQSPSRDDILEAALAALTADDIPPDEDCLDWPDPDSGPPPELADLTTPELEELIAAQPDPVAEMGPAGFWPRDRSGGGCGFADGGELDVLGLGVPLAGFADDAHARLAALTDDELIGVLRAWRRQTSWAQARELAAVAELARFSRSARRTRPRFARWPRRRRAMSGNTWSGSCIQRLVRHDCPGGPRGAGGRSGRRDRAGAAAEADAECKRQEKAAEAEDYRIGLLASGAGGGGRWRGLGRRGGSCSLLTDPAGCPLTLR